MKYHCSYDWIMPVVEYINAKYGESALIFMPGRPNESAICSIWMSSTCGTSAIDAIFGAVVTFIKKQNKQNENKTTQKNSKKL